MRGVVLNWAWVLIFILIGSCTERIDLDLESGKPQLVVEAEMSNLEESYIVKLSFTTDFRGISDRSSVREADVRIIEEVSGESLELFEIFPGEYYSFGGAFQGEVGGSYFLRIVLTDGTTYESSMVRIPEPVQIRSTDARLREETFVNSDLIEDVVYFEDLYVELENTDEDHFVIFDNQGFIESLVRYGLCGGFGPDSPDGPAGPSRCWAFRDPIATGVYLASNRAVGSISYEALAGSIPFVARGQYVVDIEAKAMEARSFNFWQQTVDQLEKGDGIFDAPFAPIIGNIRNVDDPEEIVLGYFNAYAKSTATICFDWPAIGSFSQALVGCFTLCTDFYAPATFDLPVEQICR